jgi:Ca-activated chloride channel family protein
VRHACRFSIPTVTPSRTRSLTRALPIPLTLALALLLSVPAFAAGTLTAQGSPDEPVRILDHRVQVVINNGFSQTEVVQTFYNPNPYEVEATYSFPLPESASLSEVTVKAGEIEIQGEVVEAQEAEDVYTAEKDRGRQAGIATQNGYQDFEFRVAPIPAEADVEIRFIYYQPIEIDTGIGRYLYPLEEGGTDAAAEAFWFRHEKVDGLLTIDVELRSAYPVADVRAPGLEGASQIDKLDEGHYRLHVEQVDTALDRDFVFYYRLADGLPGRVDLLTQRDDPAGPGTFMLVITPGIDLGPLTGGADYVFVLDVSGSMESKLATLVDGVQRGLKGLDPEDRFRVVTFSDRARDISRGWQPATPENVEAMLDKVARLHVESSTNLYAGLDLALRDLDDDRATSVILVTDAVTNTGVVDPAEFHRLMQTVDVRVFGFLLGNSGNWPLMETITRASGGFYTQVSNRDDLLGKVLLAKEKVTHEALLDVDLKLDGADVFAVTPEAPGKLYRGQQLVLFGRYDRPAAAKLELEATLTGADKTYTTFVDLPEHDDRYPELERLWALAQIEDIGRRRDAGLLPASEAEASIRDLGLEYQLVTEETSMVVLTEEAFLEHGIERRNRDRIAREHAAQTKRRAAAIHKTRADRPQPMFDRPAARPSSGGGGGSGAVDPLSLLAMAGLAGLGLALRRRF